MFSGRPQRQRVVVVRRQRVARLADGVEKAAVVRGREIDDLAVAGNRVLLERLRRVPGRRRRCSSRRRAAPRGAASVRAPVSRRTRSARTRRGVRRPTATCSCRRRVASSAGRCRHAAPSTPCRRTSPSPASAHRRTTGCHSSRASPSGNASDTSSCRARDSRSSLGCQFIRKDRNRQLLIPGLEDRRRGAVAPRVEVPLPQHRQRPSASRESTGWTCGSRIGSIALACKEYVSD